MDASPLPCTVRGRFAIAAGGDVIGPGEPVTGLGLAGVDAVAELFRAADVGFANHEGSVFDLASFGGTRAAVNGGGYPLSPPSVARDLRAFGLTLMSKANNHATDWGVEGMLASAATLEAAGIGTAGTGISRAAAVRPVHVATRKGRVALVAFATTFTAPSVAGSPGGEFVARPGIFAVRVAEVTLVPRDRFAALREVATAQASGALDDRSAQVGDDDVRIGTERFRAADAPGIAYTVDRRDRADLLRSVRNAKQMADLVIIATHSHESASGAGGDRRPPQFLIDLFHDAVDEGADVGLATGPHVVRGAEIYRGKPLLYGLGSLFLEMGSGLGLEPDALRTRDDAFRALTPAEMIGQLFELPPEWFDGIVATMAFDDGSLAEVHVHPIELSQQKGHRIQGWPTAAAAEAAERILRRFVEDSALLGQSATIEDGTAVLRP